MTRLALVSDLHANLAAVEAVLADIARRGITDIYCLGDVVGYGPDPKEVLGMVNRFRGTVMGNHDHAILHGTEHTFNPKAQLAIDWTRAQLQPTAFNLYATRPLMAALQGFVPAIRLGDDLLAHGSPVSNAEYVLDGAAAARALALPACAGVRRLFVGHVHIAGWFRAQGERLHYFKAVPEEPFALAAGERAVINVGSVGQPRDGDWRSSYVELDGENIIYHRVEYDVAATVKKILAIPELDDSLAHRLQPKTE